MPLTYAAAAIEYAHWLAQPPEKATDVIERSKKYARAVKIHRERVYNTWLLKNVLENDKKYDKDSHSSFIVAATTGGITSTTAAVNMATHKCVNWIQDAAQKWMTDVIDHEDNIHIQHLTTLLMISSRSALRGAP
jgi:hypothetical protein